MQKLELALEKGSKKYNVNFIIFEEAKKINIMTSKKWYKEHIKNENGIWLGRGFSNQYTFRISNTSEDTKKDLIDDNYAIVIENGIAQIVKILNSREESQNG